MISLGSSNSISVLCRNHMDEAFPDNVGLYGILGYFLREIFVSKSILCLWPALDM